MCQLVVAEAPLIPRTKKMRKADEDGVHVRSPPSFSNNAHLYNQSSSHLSLRSQTRKVHAHPKTLIEETTWTAQHLSSFTIPHTQWVFPLNFQEKEIAPILPISEDAFKSIEPETSELFKSTHKNEGHLCPSTPISPTAPPSHPPICSIHTAKLQNHLGLARQTRPIQLQTVVTTAIVRVTQGTRSLSRYARGWCRSLITSLIQWISSRSNEAVHRVSPNTQEAILFLLLTARSRGKHLFHSNWRKRGVFLRLSPTDINFDSYGHQESLLCSLMDSSAEITLCILQIKLIAHHASCVFPMDPPAIHQWSISCSFFMSKLSNLLS